MKLQETDLVLPGSPVSLVVFRSLELVTAMRPRGPLQWDVHTAIVER